MNLKNIRVRNDFEAEIKRKDGKIRRLGAVGAFLVFLLFLSAYSDYVEQYSECNPICFSGGLTRQ